MAKYYVVSGQIKFIIDSPDEQSAILATIQKYYGKGLMTGPKICISEKGFKDKNSNCYNTDDYIKGKR